MVISAAFLLLTCCCLCGVLGMAASAADAEAKDKMAKNMAMLPVLGTFLKSNAHKYTPKEGGQDTCAVCLDEFSETDGKEVVELKCASQHVFHKDCIKAWVEKGNNSCPNCREAVL
jgi:hypothetical protein